MMAATPSLFDSLRTAYLSDEDDPALLESAYVQVESACSANPARLEFVQATVCHLLQQQLIVRDAPRFWQQAGSAEQLPQAVHQLHALVTRRSAGLLRLQALCDRLQASPLFRPPVSSTVENLFDPPPVDYPDFVLHQLEAVLFSQIQPGFDAAVRKLYSDAIRAHWRDTGQQIPGDPAAEGQACPGCRAADPAACCCSQLLDQARLVSRQLAQLRLLTPLAGGAIAALISDQMRCRVESMCDAGFSRSWVSQVETWCDSLMDDWRSLLGEDVALKQIRPRAVNYMYERFARRRIAQLFDIIVDFPDSRPALDDLRACLQRAPLRSELVTSLRRAISSRLLHPAANTEDILSAYVSAVRALRLLEPSGLLVELVGEPIRQYLRGRDDTVRCIVASLTEEGGGPLADELVRGEPTSTPPDGDTQHWEDWQPYPRDAPPARDTTTNPQADIISMLVNIYGSKNTFVKEYRKLLADRILKQTTYDLDREHKYLELLKLRFGETELHECDVMLKDLFNSHRINWHIHSEESRRQKSQTVGVSGETSAAEKKSSESPQSQTADSQAHPGQLFPVKSLILSAQFWPDFREETLVLPEEYEQCLEEYTKEYQALKGNRTLCWKRHLGTVELEVELGGRRLELSVTPVHAVILHHFQTRSVWTAAELSHLMRVPVSALRRKLSFWLSQGVLAETAPDTYQLVEAAPSGGGDGAASGAGGLPPAGVTLTDAALMEDDTESPMTSTEDQKARDLEVFWNYIVGMLTNLESLPLDRIQAMLRMFAMEGAEECSTQELRHFLDKKVKQHKLLFSGGLYRLPKS